MDRAGEASGMSHTPGPWMVSTGTDIVRDHDSLTHLGWANGWSGATADEARANARLMAAAPDLLAACEAAVDAVEMEWPGTDLLDQLRAAIAKARGES